MTRKILSLFLFSALLLALPQFNDHASAALFGRGNGEKFVEKLSKELTLTKEQKDAFLKSVKMSGEEEKKIREKNEAIMQKMDSEMQKDSPDAGLIAKLIDEMDRNMTQVKILRMKGILELRKSLNTEQAKKFKEFEKKRTENMKKMQKKRADKSRACRPHPMPY